MDSKKRQLLALIEGWVSIISNILLFILKYWAGVSSGSVAIIADAWHTLSDSISSIVIIVGAKIAAKPPDDEHPFGHGRAELIASVMVGVLLSMVAFDIFLESFQKIREQQTTHYGVFAIVVTIISIVVKEISAQYAFWAGRKTKNQSLTADGWHHRSDAISSAVILLGIFFQDYFWWIDGALGIMISLLIAFAVYKILEEAIDSLIGKSPDNEMISKITKLSNKVAECDIFVHHIHIHTYGLHGELTFHIKLPAHFSLEKVFEITSKITRKIREELQLEATILTEPIEKKNG